MTSRSILRHIAVLGALTVPTFVQAAELPQIKVSDDNQVMACATPGRLMAFVKTQNTNMPDKFEGLATEYMRNGEELKIRWDYAFFQMLVETAFLKFTGDVNVSQNNFAGLGAIGGGAKGESFPDVASGARAHLQHVLMYTGDPVDNPVAQRTRDIQAWGVLTKWQKTIKRPMTFKDLASKWAPTSRGYPRDIVSVAERFERGLCTQDDPQPELVAEARGGNSGDKPDAKIKAAAAGSAKAQKDARKDAKKDGKAQTAGKDEPAADEAAEAPPAAATPDAKPAAETAKADATQGVKVLNSPPAAPATPANDPPEQTTAPQKAADKAAAKAAEKSPDPATDKKFETASVAAGAAKAKVAEPAAGSAGTASKCKVWQASYGGSKAIIIKATAEKMTNYTVLDVNDGAEKREADAYIAAYAKGGATVGEFDTSAQALEKAFQMCPEG